MAAKDFGYVPAPEFKEDTYHSLFDIQFNHNTELWLLQLPDDQFPDIDGQSLTLDLDQDGELGSVEGPDGTVYSLVNFPSEVADTTVFQPTPSGTKVVGKISRHVSLIHYPEPKHGTTDVASKKRKPVSSKTTFTRSQFSTPTRTTTHKNVSSQSSSRKRMITDSGGTSKSGRSRQSGDSGPGHSGVSTVSGSSEQSHHKKSK
ncbi:mediator-associated protein 2 [Silene latifolia]|uniref:mediator-associated protein 2 n=1 Tax=Silene latifolia TaxID=37657 RepID=UPI003D7735F3